MPTPFYHLNLAKDLLLRPELPSAAQRLLWDNGCIFQFGTTAPDVQVISNQPRQQTHFFSLPILEGDPPAWELILAENPTLADIDCLPPAQAAFLAGYLCHLQADWLWIKEIFAPVFGPRCSWGSFRERLYLHNVLRAYLDRQVLSSLAPDLPACLSVVTPGNWLPFVEDLHLIQWRDFISLQLLPGAGTQTVEVFASRMGSDVLEFQALVSSEQRMQREVFTHLPLEKVSQYRQHVLDENVHLLDSLLNSRGAVAFQSRQGFQKQGVIHENY